MAGDCKIDVVSGAINTGASATTDFTITGFGTPVACIIKITFDTTDGSTSDAEYRYSLGFSDFTNHRSISGQTEDASANEDANHARSATLAYRLLDVAGSAVGSGTASAITDGVRLTNGDAFTAAAFVTVTLIGGADVSALVGTVTANATENLTTVVTTSIDQDIVFFVGNMTNSTSIQSNVIGSYGVATTGREAGQSIANKSLSWSVDQNGSVGDPFGHVNSNRCLSLSNPSGSAGSISWGIELTAADATTFTVTSRDGAPGSGQDSYYLAIALDPTGTRLKSAIGSIDSPVASGNWSKGSIGFKPQYVELGITQVIAEDTSYGNGTVGSIGWSSVGVTAEAAHSVYDEDGSATINANNCFRSQAIYQFDNDGSTIAYDLSFSSFDAGGWTYSQVGTPSTTASKWIWVAIEEAPTGADIARDPPAGNLTLATVAPTQQINTPVASGNLSLSTVAPTQQINNPIPSADLTLSTVAPTLLQTFDVPRNPANAELVLTTSIPTVNQTFDIAVDVPGDNLTLTTTAPEISVLINKAPATAELSINTTAPIINQTLDISKSPAAGQLTISTAGSSQQLSVPVASGNLVLSSEPPAVLQTFDIAVSVANTNLSLSTAAPAVLQTFDISLAPAVAQLTITTVAPVILQTFDVARSPANAELTISTAAPSLGASINIPVGEGTLTLSTVAPAVSTGADLPFEAPTAQLSLTTAAPTQQLGVPVASGSLSITTAAPTVLAAGDVDRTVPAAELVIGSTTPAVNETKKFSPANDNLVITTEPPVALRTGDVLRTPATGQLSLSTSAPILSLTSNFSVAAGNLIIISTPPEVVATTGAKDFFPANDNLVISTTSPIIQLIRRFQPEHRALTLSTAAPVASVFPEARIFRVPARSTCSVGAETRTLRVASE